MHPAACQNAETVHERKIAQHAALPGAVSSAPDPSLPVEDALRRCEETLIRAWQAYALPDDRAGLLAQRCLRVFS